MIEIAGVFLILTFFGQNTVLTLPMANMVICESEKEAIQAAYEVYTTGRLASFAHCFKSRPREVKLTHQPGFGAGQ